MDETATTTMDAMSNGSHPTSSPAPPAGAGHDESPPLAVGFVGSLEELFSMVRERGLLLSPMDVEIARRWEADGIPLRLCLRTIVDGLARYGRYHGRHEHGPQGLAYFDPMVRKAAGALAAKLSLPTSVRNGAPQPFVSEEKALEARLASLKRALDHLGSRASGPLARRVYRDAWRAVISLVRGLGESRIAPADAYEKLAALPDEMVASFVARHPDAEREALEAAAQAAIKGLEGTMGTMALEERRRDALRQAALDAGLVIPKEVGP